MTNLATIEQTPEPQRGTSVTTPSQLLAMAVQQGADLDKLEKLMALQERWEASEARKAYQAAMSAFKAEPVRIVKAKQVSFSGTSYKHAELSDVTEALGPALAKHDLSFRWDVRQDSNTVTVDCVLTHIAGHSERITMSGPPDDSGKKNRIQQIASTVTYLQRYTLLAITGTSTVGDDDDGAGAGDDPEADVVADWLSAVADSQTKDELDDLAGQLRAAKLSDDAKKRIRAAWAARAKEIGK
jgi:hypothetical protein